MPVSPKKKVPKWSHAPRLTNNETCTKTFSSSFQKRVESESQKKKQERLLQSFECYMKTQSNISLRNYLQYTGYFNCNYLISFLKLCKNITNSYHRVSKVFSRCPCIENMTLETIFCLFKIWKFSFLINRKNSLFHIVQNRDCFLLCSKSSLLL